MAHVPLQNMCHIIVRYSANSGNYMQGLSFVMPLHSYLSGG
jgi:hypothetical protein